MHLKSLLLIMAAFVNMVTTLPEPQDQQKNQEIHFLPDGQEKHGQQHGGQENHGQQLDGQENHGQQHGGQERHGDHSEVKTLKPKSRPIPTRHNDHHHSGNDHHSEVEHLKPQSRPLPTKHNDHHSGDDHHHVHHSGDDHHHHVHSTSPGVPQIVSQFLAQQQSQPAQQFGQFPFGFQQPSPQLLNCQCYSPFQPGFQQPQLYNAFPVGIQQPSTQFGNPNGFRQSSQQLNALPPSSKQPRQHCHVTCHEH